MLVKRGAEAAAMPACVHVILMRLNQQTGIELIADLIAHSVR